MTFDTAFTFAANHAQGVTVEGKPRTWLERFRLRARDRFRPSLEERVKAMESLRGYCRDCYLDGEEPDKDQACRIVRAELEAGPLTWLWILSMVAKLLIELNWRLNNNESAEPAN